MKTKLIIFYDCLKTTPSSLCVLVALSLWSLESVALDFRAGFTTDFPLHSGVEAQLHLQPIYFSAQSGILIGPYVNAGNSIAESMGLTDPSAAPIISALATGALNSTLRLGFAPEFLYGALMEVGFSYLAGGGSLKKSELSAAGVSGSDGGSGSTFSIALNIQSVNAHLGYQFSLGSVELIVRLGIEKVIGAEASARISGSTALNNAVSAGLNSYVQSIYNQYFLPTASLSVLYRFGEPPPVVPPETTETPGDERESEPEPVSPDN